MRAGFYPKLAWEGIRKNRRLYVPYILTGSVMVMMYYILSFLSESPEIEKMRGGSVLMTALPLGCWVIALFSLLFLFYTNSFLIRQRYREFGLYNILGMDKKNIGRVMVWECLFVAILAIACGLIAGIAFSKMAELILLNLLDLPVTFELSIGISALYRTPMIFGAIYFLLLIHSLIRVRRSRPLELMKSSRVGERIPKRTWVYAAAGVIFLGIAYYLAISIEEPLTALSAFFIAVILVIGATYLLFMSGSVSLCRLLQKNKKYYYKPNHFISVSSMVYRMKRNGAGLASICILLTMVLVMLASTASLYAGKEDSIRARYPSEVNIQVTVNSVDGFRDENMDELRGAIEKTSGIEVEKDYRAGQISGLFTDNGLVYDSEDLSAFGLADYDKVGTLIIVPLEDYNRMSGVNETLAGDECMIFCSRTTYDSDTFVLEGGRAFKVKKVLDKCFLDDDLDGAVTPSIVLVVDNFEGFTETILPLRTSNDRPVLLLGWQCGFNLDSTQSEIEAAGTVRETLRVLYEEGKNDIYEYSVESREDNRQSFLELNGSLLFLGIMLSIVFLLAAVLIIYYKQISEGYEDQSRFDIMQKVGMTKKEIRRSINSQILTVFFLPLIFAGVHLAFAFPFVWKILMMFGLNNRALIIAVTAACFVAFGLLYVFVYKITSNSYYSIVSGRKG